MSTTPVIDVIIAVHDARRPIARAVSSALRAAESPKGEAPVAVRVSVIAHGLDPQLIRERLADAPGSLDTGTLDTDARVRILPFTDGIASPAGPFNAGLDAADAEWVSVMGSDDELEPGALHAWLAAGRAANAVAVIPPLRHAPGRAVPTPPVRPRRRIRRDPVRDRLAYRTAPLGLLRRDACTALRMTVGLPSGEDLEFGLSLWFAGAPITYAVGAPAYLIHSDAVERVTLTARPIADDMVPLAALRASGLFAARTPAERRAIVIKLIRIHIFGAVANRPDASTWTAADHAALRAETAALLALAPTADRVFSLVDRTLLDTIASASATPADLITLANKRRARVHPANLITRDLRGLFDREGPLRFAAASVLATR